MKLSYLFVGIGCFLAMALWLVTAMPYESDNYRRLSVVSVSIPLAPQPAPEPSTLQANTDSPMAQPDQVSPDPEKIIEETVISSLERTSMDNLLGALPKVKPDAPSPVPVTVLSKKNQMGYDVLFHASSKDDILKAIELLENESFDGNPESAFNLGQIYLSGRLGVRDLAKAADWYGVAAEYGFAPAEFNLGLMYIKGMGVPYDYQQAIQLFKKAALNGSEKAHRLLIKNNIHYRFAGM
jgi:hypothetical protein